MKKALGFFIALLIFALLLFSIQHFLFPFVFKIIEPRFLMPVVVNQSVETAADLPIRNDAYGDGAYGEKRRGGRRHKGIDLQAEMNCPVFASKSGWAEIYSYPGGYGKLVIIKHPGGWETRYGHLDSIAIKKPGWVRRGKTIGFIGKSGNADTAGITPHLHFEIRKKGEPIDPAPELVRPTPLP